MQQLMDRLFHVRRVGDGGNDGYSVGARRSNRRGVFERDAPDGDDW